MKVLWLCNIMLPAIAGELGLPGSNKEGWLTGLYERICREKEAVTGLGVCFPVTKQIADRLEGKKSFRLKTTGTLCYPFLENTAVPEVYDASMENRFREILEDFRPEVVHIFGTEYPHTLAMVRAFPRPERILTGIQGLCFACAEAYMADLPERVAGRRTFRDFIRRDSLRQQQEKFRIRGEREKEALSGSGNITGRTEFDRRETEKINGNARYFFLNETLRAPFYSGCWNRESCVPHRIFLSQGDYPLKGFHYVLQALPAIREVYPETVVCVAGNSLVEYRTWKDKLRISSYGKYLRGLIGENEEKSGNGSRKSHVEILGRLSAEEMKEQYLKSSLFVCPSALENSPNSMGEAMLLGVPVVAARTGGIPSMIREETEGLLYDAGNVDQLAEAVIRVWREPEETLRRTRAARERALAVHDPDRNYERLLEIYREICI